MDRLTLRVSLLILALLIGVCQAQNDDSVTTVLTGNRVNTEPYDIISKGDDSDHHVDDHDGHADPHGNNSDHHSNHTDHHGGHGIHVATWNYKYVEAPLVIVICVIVTAICRLGFHHLEYISSKVPESCLLILLGSLVGLVMRYTAAGEGMVQSLDPRTFFLFLLPQIILESAYSLHDRVFFDNLGTILWYAVIGTLLNWLIIGPALYGLSSVGAFGDLKLEFIPCMIFSALIVAVDPVAVLAIFQEVGVNNVLYFLVFGESLMNDAVTVVLYNTMNALNDMETVTIDQIFLAIAAFFTVSLGGLSIGILYGLFTSFLTKYTEKVKVVEPLAVFTLAYASYLTAELFHFSGIISIIGCGLTQAQYAFHNIGHKSLTTVTYFAKMLSSASDSVIFMFLGISLVRSDHQWNTGFVLCSVFLCLLVRFFGVFFLTFVANKARLRKIDYEEQFIMAYGGLRGAVAFCLVAMLNIPEENIFETATLVVIIFTVFIQGMSIKPLVKLLRIKTAGTEEDNISTEINCHVVDHVVSGIEEILGRFGRNAVREFFDHYDDLYLKHWFQRYPQSKDDSIMEMYHDVTINQHYDALQRGESYKETPYILADPIPHGPEDKSVLPDELGRTVPIKINSPDEIRDVPVRRLGGWKSFDSHTLNPDLSHRTLDVQMRARRRRSDITGLTTNRKSDPVAPTQPKAEYESFLSQPGETPAGARSPAQRRWNKLKRVLSLEGSTEGPQEIKSKPTASDFRSWAVKPVRESMGQKYDKNLIRDQENDLVHHLDQKAKRLERLLSTNMYQSMASVRTPSPRGSREFLPASPTSPKPRFATIDEVGGEESIEMEEKGKPQEKTTDGTDLEAAAVSCPESVSDDKEKLLDKEKSAKGRGILLRQHELAKERQSPASDASSLT